MRETGLDMVERRCAGDPAHAAPLPAGNARGMLAMIAAMALFVVNDVFVKLAGARLPVSEIMVLRGLVAVALLYALTRWMGALRPARMLVNGPVAGRVASEIASTTFFLFGLMSMPFAEANAILQFGPLLLTAAAALFLGEQVGWRRWLAALAGLLGVLLMVKPGTSQFTWYAMLPVLSVLSSVVRDLSTRRIDPAIPSLMLALTTALSITVAGCAIAVFQDWHRPLPEDLVGLAMAAALLAVGYLAVIVSVRTGELSVVAPFRYSIVIFALLAGYLVWGELPDQLSIVGMVVVTAAGLYTFLRERKLNLDRVRLARLPEQG